MSFTPRGINPRHGNKSEYLLTSDIEATAESDTISWLKYIALMSRWTTYGAWEGHAIVEFLRSSRTCSAFS
jgi:hypothetical protein